jgi:N-acetylmuramoyl-L-alanine amidase
MVPGDIVAKKLGLNYSWNNRLLSGVISKGSTDKPAPSTPSNTKPQTSNPSGSTTKITASESDYSIRIKKPDGLSSSSISSNDDYWNKQLQIIIDGDYRNFFNTASNRTIKDSLTYKVSYLNGKTYINLITSTIKGFSVTQTDSYIYVKYAAPKDMFYRIIVIDAGHGGKDSGATGNGYIEI